MTNTQEQILLFLKHCADTIKRRSDNSDILEGVEAFTKKLDVVQEKSFNAELLPVLDNLDSIKVTPYTFNFHEIAKEMIWRPSPRTDENGKQMALGIFNELFDLGNLIVGLLLVDKHASYPLHQHIPQEIYLVLSGEADWRYGGAENFRKLIPGDVIYNHSNDLHGVNANDEPVLAIYILWN